MASWSGAPLDARLADRCVLGARPAAGGRRALAVATAGPGRASRGRGRARVRPRTRSVRVLAARRHDGAPQPRRGSGAWGAHPRHREIRAHRLGIRHQPLGRPALDPDPALQRLLRLRPLQRTDHLPGLDLHRPPKPLPVRAHERRAGDRDVLPGPPRHDRRAAAAAARRRLHRHRSAARPVRLRPDHARGGRPALGVPVGARRLGGHRRLLGLAGQPGQVGLGRGRPLRRDLIGGGRHGQPLLARRHRGHGHLRVRPAAAGHRADPRARVTTAPNEPTRPRNQPSSDPVTSVRS